MKAYINKVSHTLLIGLVILLIFTVIYLVIPKYQIQSVRVDENSVMITKINTLTGRVDIDYERYKSGIPIFGKPKISKFSIP